MPSIVYKKVTDSNSFQYQYARNSMGLWCCSTVQDEVEEGEEADEDDVPSLLSLEQTNGGGGDHLLLGEVMTSLVF